MIKLNPYLTKEIEVSGESYTFSISKFPEEKIAKLFDNVRKKIGYSQDNEDNIGGDNENGQMSNEFVNHTPCEITTNSSKCNIKSTKIDSDQFCEEKQHKKFKDMFNKYKNIPRQLLKRKTDHNVKPCRNSTSNILSKDDDPQEHQSKHVKTFSTSSIGTIIRVEKGPEKSSDHLDGSSSFNQDKEYINGPYCDLFDLNVYFRMLSFSNSRLKMSHYPKLHDQDALSGEMSAICTDTNKSTPTATNTSPDLSKTSKVRKNTSSSTFAEPIPEHRKLKTLISNENFDDHFVSNEDDFKVNNNLRNHNEHSEVFESYKPAQRRIHKKSTFDTFVRDDSYNALGNYIKQRKSSIRSSVSHSNLIDGRSEYYPGSSVRASNMDSVLNRDNFAINQTLPNNDFEPRFVGGLADFDMSTIGDPMELISLPKDVLVRYICTLKNTVEQMKNPEYPIERRKMSTSSRQFSLAKIGPTASINSDASSVKSHVRRGSVFSSILYSNRQHQNNISVDMGGLILEEDDPLAILYKRKQELEKYPSVPPKIKKKKNKN